MRPLLAVSLLVSALFAASWGHNLPYQQYPAGGQTYYDASLQNNVLGEQDGQFPSQTGGNTYQQQEEFEETEGDTFQQQEEFDSDEEGMMEQEDFEDGANEGEGQRANLMYMSEDDTEVEEQIAGEFFEGPSESFMEMEQTPPEDDEDSPSEQHHHKSWFPRGKRSVEDALVDLESIPQDGEVDGGEGNAVIMAQWNNNLHGRVNVVCPAGLGLFHMQSAFYSAQKDRRFLFTCKRVAPLCGPGAGYSPAKRQCSWRKMNNIASTGSFTCPSNYYLAGVQSAANCKHDREWTGLCCRTPNVCLTGCSWTNYLNGFGQNFNYRTGGVFFGMISVYNPTVMDRRYRVAVCSVKTC